MLKSLRKALHLGGPSATNQQDHAAGAPADNGSAENDSYTFELQCSSMAAANVPFGTTAGCVEVHDGASGGLLGSTGSCRPPGEHRAATGRCEDGRCGAMTSEVSVPSSAKSTLQRAHR